MTEARRPRPYAKKTNHGHRRLLRTRRKWPGNCRNDKTSE